MTSEKSDTTTKLLSPSGNKFSGTLSGLKDESFKVSSLKQTRFVTAQELESAVRFVAISLWRKSAKITRHNRNKRKQATDKNLCFQRKLHSMLPFGKTAISCCHFWKCKNSVAIFWNKTLLYFREKSKSKPSAHCNSTIGNNKKYDWLITC